MKKQKQRPANAPHVLRLYKAVQDLVKKEGGKVAVVGGVTAIMWPYERKNIFHISVKCVGQAPIFKRS